MKIACVFPLVVFHWACALSILYRLCLITRLVPVVWLIRALYFGKEYQLIMRLLVSVFQRKRPLFLPGGVRGSVLMKSNAVLGFTTIAESLSMG